MGKLILTVPQENLLIRVSRADLPASMSRDEKALMRANLIRLDRRPGVLARLALTPSGSQRIAMTVGRRT